MASASSVRPASSSRPERSRKIIIGINHPAARLDAVARTATALMWVAAAVLWALAGGALLTGSSGVGVVMVFAAALIAGLCAYYRRRQPLAYRIESDALVVVERSGERRIDGPVGNARDGGLGLRVLGSGGLYGYLGRFRLADRKGPARAFVSDLRRVAVVDVGTVAVAISPQDKAAFLQEARDA